VIDVATDPAAVLEVAKVQSLQQLSTEKGCLLCAKAAAKGDKKLLQWLYEQGCEWDDTTLIAAAMHGHAGNVTWALEHGCPWHLKTCSPMDVPAHVKTRPKELLQEAARHGGVPLLQWLHTLGCPWDVFVCATAAGTGRQAVVQWLLDNGCPWDVNALHVAAFRGHMELLKWAIRHGCHLGPFFKMMVLLDVVRHGHTPTLKWLQQHTISEHP
jgi:hypothetical protein